MKVLLALGVVLVSLQFSLANSKHTRNAEKHQRSSEMVMGDSDPNILELAAVNGRECYADDLGVTYRGRRDVTASGYTCQRWDEQYPHEHARNDVTQFPDALYNKLNFCRNPDRTTGIGPWCYTTNPDVRWETCGVPRCPDCKATVLGTEYRGRRNSTLSGLQCQRWDSQHPHQHTRNDPSQFPNAVYNEANYCRNPDNEPEGPWCYTTDPDVRWQYCGLPLCTECKTDQKGLDYRGTHSTTVSGLTCQRWDSQTPHEHSRNDVSQFPGAAHNEANYCRNPDETDGIGPWCYTLDPLVRWEACDIPFCPWAEDYEEV